MESLYKRDGIKREIYLKEDIDSITGLIKLFYNLFGKIHKQYIISHGGILLLAHGILIKNLTVIV